MMIAMRLGAKYDSAMAELWCARTSLSGPPRSLLSVWFLVSTRYFSTSLGRSIALTAIHQLRGDNLVENRHIGGDSEHLLAQFELFYGLSGHVIHCSRGHFGYLPHHMLLNHEQAAIGTRYRTLYHQQIALRIRLNHLQFLCRHARVTHMTGHAGSLQNAARRRTRTNRTRRARTV